MFQRLREWWREVTAPIKNESRYDFSSPTAATVRVGKKEGVLVEGQLFLRQRLPDINGIWTFANFAYFCPKCGDQLAEGPSGGLSVNAVCETCRINWGCLPGFHAQ